jgi:ABC-type dipeptide/oligopeptide/nickel transport system permease subunit
MNSRLEGFGLIFLLILLTVGGDLGLWLSMCAVGIFTIFSFIRVLRS